jgi:hypothetical protein
VLMEDVQAPGDAPWRLMWLKDAFGAPSLIPALPKDTWDGGNILSWYELPQHLFGESFRGAQSKADLAKLWECSLDSKSSYFTCAPPGSDAGLQLDLGVAYEVAAVSDDWRVDDGIMGTILTPSQFKKAKILRTENGLVWFETPVWKDDPTPFLCVTTAEEFKDWAKENPESLKPTSAE